MTTALEGTVERSDGALTAVSRESGVMALAYMNPEEFESRLVALKQGQDRVRRIQRELMVLDEDYGIIPGTKKPTLYKAGAEKLCNVYGLVATYEAKTTIGDGITAPVVRTEMTCLLHRGDAEGPVVGVGMGAANTWETKHRYRGAERACPSCGVEGSIRRSTFEKDGDRGWWCSPKGGGCGDNFRSDDQQITDQQRGQVENPDPFDLQNTVLKMSRKRSFIDGTLTATATSGLFTQDLEDLVGGAPPPTATTGTEAQPAQGKPATQAQSTAAGATTRAQQQGPKPAAPATNGSIPKHGQKWQGPCPECGKTQTVYVSKKADEPGWYCWKKASANGGGCGATFTEESLAFKAEADRLRAAQTTIPGTNPTPLPPEGVPATPAARGAEMWDDPFGSTLDGPGASK